MEKLNRKFHRRILLMVIGMLAIGVPCSLPAQSAAEKMLLAKAQSLAAHGRLDMAVQTWQQVLLSNPKNTEALAGIAKADMQLGKQDEARQYLDRLRAAGGNPAAISQIQAMPHVAPQSDRLNEASRLAQNGQYAQAMRSIAMSSATSLQRATMLSRTTIQRRPFPKTALTRSRACANSRSNSLPTPATRSRWGAS